MSHQTGIQADDNLRKLITNCKSDVNNIRVIKIMIIDEQLRSNEQHQVLNDWKSDWNKYSTKLIECRQPCYLLFRLDSVNGLKQFEWSLISWTPDDSNVRQKMLYASTKATLKTTFGGGSIAFDYLATCKSDMTLDAFVSAYEQNKDRDQTSNAFSRLNIETNSNEHLLTEKEQNLLAVKRHEALASSNLNHKNSRSLPGLQFPLTETATNAIENFKNGTINYIQLSINSNTEEIDLTDQENNRIFSIENLPNKMPINSPRYHLFRFSHEHDNKHYDNVIFVYSVPSGQCPVKERMLYSSCKNSLVTAIQDKNTFAINIDRKLESDTPNEITLDYLISELHPPEDTGKPKFEKPKGPSGARGAKRLIKVNDK